MQICNRLNFSPLHYRFLVAMVVFCLLWCVIVSCFLLSNSQLVVLTYFVKSHLQAFYSISIVISNMEQIQNLLQNHILKAAEEKLDAEYSFINFLSYEVKLTETSPLYQELTNWTI